MTEISSDLKGKAQVFVREYLRDCNATRAAIAAGYAASSASQAGSRLYRNVKVRSEIERLTSKRLIDLEIDAKRVLRGLAQLAFYDPRQMFNDNGSLKAITEMDEVSAMALKGIDVQSTETIIPNGGIGGAEAETKGAASETKGTDEETPAPQVLKRRITVSKIRLADRGENLERLGRHLKLFTDRVEFEDTTPYDPERDDARITQLLGQAILAAGREARP
jgi:phage terminase small subunit